jgi:hypothetical protein
LRRDDMRYRLAGRDCDRRCNPALSWAATSAVT